jgi:membrane protease YdiL (CAAX protease family)/tetratricopeptide (TPR) repeat protein
MPLNSTSSSRFPSLARALVIFVSIVSLSFSIVSLVLSANQPQVQSNLQLYQTDLNLQAADFPVIPEGIDPENLRTLQTALLGDDPYATAAKQYREARDNARETIVTLRENAPNVSLRRRGNPLYEEINLLTEIEIKLGTIEASRGKTAEALQIWRSVIENSDEVAYKPALAKKALLLEGLYSDPPRVEEGTEARIQRSFRGWFRYVALEKLYAIQNRSEDLETLQREEAERAIGAIGKLLIVSLLPIGAASIGIVILLVLVVQFFVRKERSLLYIGDRLSWETPWDWYTLCLGLGIGFFFVGQIALPLVFGGLWALLSIDPGSFNLQYKAVYIVFSYLAMTIAGLTILYLSLAPFRPLPAHWFPFRWGSRWILWGFGGYFVALPLVIVVSLINQQIWHGQGGSNPLLMLALESRDTFALLCFAFTATIAAPFFEEIIFRGFLLSSLTKYLPVWGAIVVSALVFALAHQSLSEVLPLTTLGCILGFVYTRSRNLLASMLVHGLWNGGTLLSLFILGSSAN